MRGAALASEQPWKWPLVRLLVFYHWSWFDPQQGRVIAGWSRRNTLDEHGFVHLGAEDMWEPSSMEVTPDVFAFTIIEPHTFSALAPLPSELCDPSGAPLPWVRTLLSTA